MNVVEMTPCVLSPKWSEFVEWSARVFEVPVACRYDDQGWGRLALSSPGVTVIDRDVFSDSAPDDATVVELNVRNIKSIVERAVEQDATLVSEPIDVGGDQWHASIETPQGIVLFLWEESTEQPDEITIGQGPVNFSFGRQIDASVEEVFEALTEAQHQKQYFVGDASADFGQEDVVTWSWEEYDVDLHMLEFTPNEYVSFSWKTASGPYHTRTGFGVTARDGGTRLTVSETGWENNPRALQDAFDHAEGWTRFLDKIRRYVEEDA